MRAHFKGFKETNLIILLLDGQGIAWKSEIKKDTRHGSLIDKEAEPSAIQELVMNYCESCKASSQTEGKSTDIV